jgi:mono/diheme cytochrome c family protein
MKTTTRTKRSPCLRVFVVAFVLLPQGSRTVSDGVYSDAQATRGGTVYADRCSACHADDLSGIDQAAPLVGADFMNDWNDQTVNDLFERIRISMPADQPGSLNRTQVADVVAFLLQKNSFPAGQTDLTSTEDTLKAIKIVAKKP